MKYVSKCHFKRARVNDITGNRKSSTRLESEYNLRVETTIGRILNLGYIEMPHDVMCNAKTYQLVSSCQISRQILIEGRVTLKTVDLVRRSPRLASLRNCQIP